MNILILGVLHTANIIDVINKFVLSAWGSAGANGIHVWFQDIKGEEAIFVTADITGQAGAGMGVV